MKVLSVAQQWILYFRCQNVSEGVGSRGVARQCFCFRCHKGDNILATMEGGGEIASVESWEEEDEGRESCDRLESGQVVSDSGGMEDKELLVEVRGEGAVREVWKQYWTSL